MLRWNKGTRPAAYSFLCLASALWACSNNPIRGSVPVGSSVQRSNLAREQLLKTHARTLEANRPPAKQDSAAAPLPTALHFAPDVDQGELLPFGVRLQKVSWVTGASSTSLDALVRGRFLLGDYDYAAGIQEQKAWTDAQMRLWMKSLLPVCESPEFASKYPWPEMGPEFVAAAMGRPATPEDTSALAHLQALPVAEGDKRTLACLTFLTSLEFLTR